MGGLTMAELKTKQTGQSVSAFMKTISDAQRRRDCTTVLKLMEEVTGAKAKMWGPSIIGLGDYHYKYASGRENDWFLVGFSPRKQNLTLYLPLDSSTRDELLAKLGKHKTGKGCIYINRVEDIDLTVLRELIEKSMEHLTRANTPAASA
jgi:hypothetical protein